MNPVQAQAIKRAKDPRYQRARYLVDAELMSLNPGAVPSDPHATENLKHAAGMLAIGEDRAQEFLEVVLRTYIGEKYRDALRRDIERIVRSAKLAHGE